jgi:diguanylate cyclase (GGDEF)-like protein/PAS domain S-box-containing protein
MFLTATRMMVMLKNEANISHIASASGVLICCIDKQYKITYLSPAWQHILKRPLDDYSQQLFTMLLVKSNQSKIQDLLVSWTENKERFKIFVCKLNTKNGVRSYEFTGQSSLENDDYQLIFNAHDISELVQLKDENKKLRIALNTPNIGYWQIDRESNEVYWSDEIYRIHGVDKAEYTPTLSSAIDFYHPEDSKHVWLKIDRAMKNGEEWTHSHRLVRSSGEVRNVLVRGNVVLSESGKPLTIFGICQDITETEALREERDMLAYAIHESTAGICLTDKNRLVIWVNKAFEKLSGYTQNELKGHTLSNFLQGENTDKEVVQQMRDQLLAGKGVHTDILNYSKSGEMYWCRLLITPVVRDGEVASFIGFQQDVTDEIEAKRKLEDVNANLEDIVKQRTLELSKANIELQYLSRHDTLTNTLNRRVFYEIYEAESARLTRKKSYLSIAMIDVDHFKLINDTVGHLAGDKVLQVLVNEINEVKRDSDYLFRFGGEEFILLMPGNNLYQSKIVAERIRQRIANLLVHYNDHDITVTVSIGLIANNSDVAASDSLKKVDKLLYQAKSNGRNCTVY